MYYHILKIENFRCFQKFEIRDLERVNLIVGPNNVGKTALLEAIYLHAGGNPYTLDETRGLPVSRIKSESLWGFWFAQANTSRPIFIDNGNRLIRLQKIDDWSTIDDPTISRVLDANSHGENKIILEVEIEEKQEDQVISTKQFWLEQKVLSSLSPPTRFTTRIPIEFITAFASPLPTRIAKLFGQLEIEKETEKVLESLRVIEPRLQRISTIAYDRETMLFCDIGLNHLIPLHLLGDGIARLARLVLSIGNARNGVVLIDEVENGFYYAVLPQVWRVLREAAHLFNVQIFATTHSLECIQAAHQTFSESTEYDFRLHRLEQGEERIHSVTFDQESLQIALEHGWEIR